MSGAVPPPAARPLERAARVPRPVCPGRGRCGRVDPAPAPQRAPLRAGVARCGGGGRAFPGGVPSTVVRGAWCQALSLPRPPVLWSGLPGFRYPCAPGAVDAGVWTQHRPHSVRPCGLALLAVGARKGVPGGGVPSTVVRGAWCQALSLPRPPVLWSGLPGFRYPCAPGAVDAGVWTLHRPHSVRPCGTALLAVGVAEGRPRGGGVPSTVVRGAWCQALPPPAARPLERAAGVPVCVCARVRALLGRVGRAGLPGAFWCASPFPLAALSFCFAWPPPGWGCPPPSRCRCRSSLPWPFVLVVFFFFFFFSSRCLALRALAPGFCLLLGRWLLVGGCSRGFCRSCLVPGCFFFFFLTLVLLSPCAPVVSGFLWFPAPAALGLGACVVCFVGLPLLGSPCACPSFVLSAWLLAAPWWLLPSHPPPIFFSRFSSLPLGAVCRVVLCVPGRGAAPRCCALCRPVLCCCVLCCVRLVPLLVAPCPLALPVALGSCALRRCVLRCSPALCALCCVCFVVARWCVLLFAALLCAVCVPGCCAVRPVCSPLCAVLCFAVLVRSRCAVRVVRAIAGAWLCGALLCVVLFPVVCRGAVLGLLAPGCLLVACFGVGVPVWPRGLLPCGWCGLLWCPAFLCRVLWCCAVAWCCAVVLCCRFAVLLGLALPFCGLSCCAVLCCWLAVLFFCPVVVSACCGALFLVLCVPCLLPSVRCGALLCWPWCLASLCRVLWRCAVVWCCAVVLCCRFAVLFVFALPSCGPSCGARVVCAVFVPVGVSLCVVVSPWAFCGVVVLLWCVVMSCCAVRCPVVSCALCRVLRCRAALRCCAGLFLAWVWLYLLEKPPQNFVKYFFFFLLLLKKKKKLYTTHHTRMQQDHVRCCALRATRRS